MLPLILPDKYTPVLDLMESQRAIKKIKDYFQQELAYGLSLRRVSAPLFVTPESGLNDNLNGVERTVQFTIKDMDEQTVEIVQSLAKWKRMALGRYGIAAGNGISSGNRELAICFARHFDSLNEETSKQILAILKRKEKEE